MTRRTSWLLCLVFALVAMPVAAQTTETIPPQPWVQEDAATLGALLKVAQQALPAANDALKAAKEAVDAPNLTPQELQDRQAAVLAAQAKVDGLQARIKTLSDGIEVAKAGPTAAQLAARRDFEALVAKAQQVRRELIAEPDTAKSEQEGLYARIIREAEEELDRRAALVDAIDKADVKNSRIYERLNDLEKLEAELRWATERFKVKVDQYDQLTQGVFAAYANYEKRAFEGMRALDDAAAKLKEFEKTKAAEMPLPGLIATDAERGALRTEIRQLLDQRRGTRGFGTSTLRITAHEGSLRQIQRAIDLREDYKEHLEQDAAKLKERMAAENRSAAKPAANEPAAPAPAAESDYAKAGDAIDVLAAEASAARLEITRLNQERAVLARTLETKLKTQKQVEDQLTASAASLKSARDNFPDDAPPSVLAFAPRMLWFELGQEIEAQNERLESARLDTRQVTTQLEILDRRLVVLQDRINEIERTALPQARSRYYEAIGRTVAIRAGKVALIFVLAWLVLWGIKRLGNPLIEGVVHRAEKRNGADAYQKQRVRTLFTVFVATMRAVIFVLALMFALGQFDLDYGPLLVAAGGVSLAVGFGAQSLVKDFFSGFFILLEGQYSIGDVVEVNGKTGTVEHLNLRTTVIRSINGDVHTVPNGEISVTTNQTKVWSRAVMDIGIAYEENVDDIIGVLESVGREMQKDEVWGRKVQDIIIPGVDSFGDNSVNVRVLLKTRAGEQWGAAREYRRRVKLKFDELGIEIPWPQRVISYKPEEVDPKGDKRRSKRAALLRYVRRMRGERVEGMEGISVEERDRAETLAKQQVAAVEQASKAEGVELPATPETPKPPVSDAERLAQNMAERMLREKEESGIRPPTRPPDPPPSAPENK
ncbi:MAG: mechanosensitive ion channel [Planctomycetes bacterium]|nr:mechanosensitive ion channel [Planctomycetota bacterium]